MEVSTSLLASMSKYLPARLLADDAGSLALAKALVGVKALLPTTTFAMLPMMGAKGQAGLDEATAAEFRQTSQNPVLLDAVGLWLIMCVFCPLLTPIKFIHNIRIWSILVTF
jgi:hypothetical protein